MKHNTHNTRSTFGLLILSLILGFLCLADNVNAKGGPPPSDPCPPITATEQYCFENSVERYSTPCSLIVCLKVTPKPEYLAVCDIIPFFLTEEHCVVLPPGERKCIDLPVFSLPASQWFDVNFTVQTIGNAWTTELDAITYPDGPYTYASPSCNTSSGHFTVLSDNGFNFIFHFMLIPGFGG